MKVSVVISVCDNRESLFDRALFTYCKQTFSKRDFEIVVVDDAQRNDLIDLCKSYHKSHNINFQYIRVDQSKSFYDVRSFTPALTNNVGFRCALGDVVVITGPEILQAENNLAVASTMNNRQQCAYGLVYLSNSLFNEYMEKGNGWKKKSFSEILAFPGAKADCLTRPPHPPAYWYFMAVKKEYVFKIRGVDEKFLGGICGEDDDFANRMKQSGIKPVFDHRIVGIHQDHSIIDKKDKHNVRFTTEWNILKSHNLKIMKENLRNRKTAVNLFHEWGNPNCIIEKFIWRNNE
jgi:glycosyltransferase involved in cell wall biosynthesis